MGLHGSFASSVIAQADTATGGDALERFIYTLAQGLAQGSIYALVALGFVLVFKATRAVNFAQGAIALVTAWFFSLVLIDWAIPGRWIDANRYVEWFLSLAIAIAIAVILGLVIERLIIRPMIGEPLFAIAVITLGLEALLRTIGTDAVTINTRSLLIPWGAQQFQIAGATIYWSWIATFIVTAVSFIGVFLFFRTRTGIAMRAVAFDQEAALAQGIPVGKVFAIAWAASSALALVAAVCASMSPIGVGTVTIGISGLALRSLPAVILGGLDSVPGALVGGLVIGLAEVFAGNYLAEYTNTLGTGYALIVPYVVMLLVLLFRPYGLFGTPEIRRV
ncbi:MAG: branched-chain amino acid transporter permease [Desertimonas sp.]|jgi:branched-chain amino acid transport system permease protein|nr:branched-chain amino acid transporter permease [Desertimonas sp.]